MGNKIRILLAVFVMIGALYWTYDRVHERNYDGSKFSFPVGGGAVTVTNRGQQPIPVEMRAEGRTSSFGIASSELELQERAQRQGSGRNIFYSVAFELPPGTTTIDVTRGDNVRFVSRTDQRVTAVVTPMDAGSVRNLFYLVGVIILAALFYISRTLEHRWLKAVVRASSRRLGRSSA